MFRVVGRLPLGPVVPDEFIVGSQYPLGRFEPIACRPKIAQKRTVPLTSNYDFHVSRQCTVALCRSIRSSNSVPSYLSRGCVARRLPAPGSRAPRLQYGETAG